MDGLLMHTHCSTPMVTILYGQHLGIDNSSINLLYLKKESTNLKVL